MLGFSYLTKQFKASCLNYSYMAASTVWRMKLLHLYDHGAVES